MGYTFAPRSCTLGGASFNDAIKRSISQVIWDFTRASRQGCLANSGDLHLCCQFGFCALEVKMEGRNYRFSHSTFIVLLLGCVMAPSFAPNSSAKPLSPWQFDETQVLIERPIAQVNQGSSVIATVNAPDGPMPDFVNALRNAQVEGQAHFVVQLENTSVLNDPELLELVMAEINELLAKHNFAGDRSQIVQCPLKCDAQQEPEPADDGSVVTLHVNAPDGPMPPFRKGLEDAQAQKIFRIVVQLENTAALNDAELLELVVFEVRELLEKHGYKGQRSEIIQCSAAC
jgi:hypothetical protein